VGAYVDETKPLRATPLARRAACEKEMDLRTLQPQGSRIFVDDVLRAAPIELTPMRRIVAERLSQSKREAPHFYITGQVDMTPAGELRRKLKAEKKRVTFNDLVMKACADALAENPALNATWDNGRIQPKTSVSVGVAVALEGGLIVPVVKDADRMSLFELSEDVRDLVERARGMKLSPDEYGGGSITVSNLGMYGVDLFVPIINPGECAILGVGRIADQVVAVNGGIGIRKIMGITVSCDHRVVDGAVAATFFQSFKRRLESPESLL
jgi:pyruvate dehydrogenase E2 component (dihydrolipoamide acetyltransferase)